MTSRSAVVCVTKMHISMEEVFFSIRLLFSVRGFIQGDCGVVTADSKTQYLLKYNLFMIKSANFEVANA